MPNNKKYTVTLDGPAGAGKSSVARYLADHLGNFAYLDTGAIYRAMAAVMAYGIPQEDGSYKPAAADRHAQIDAMFCQDEKGRYAQYMMADGHIIPDKTLRLPEISEKSSVISADPDIRERANAVARKAAGMYNLIAEGRDTGTVLFPDADMKFYLWAPAHDRADRRQRQTRDTRRLDEIIRDIKIRDERDSTREHAPLRVPDDAIWIDTGILLEDTVKRLLYDIIAARLVPGYAKAI